VLASHSLQVYEGIYCLMVRDFKQSFSLFIGQVATFTTNEVISYNDLVYYTVLTGLISIGR